MNLPRGTKARVKQAIGLMETMGDEAPANMTAFAVACMDAKINEVQARALAAGLRFKPRK